MHLISLQDGTTDLSAAMLTYSASITISNSSEDDVGGDEDNSGNSSDPATSKDALPGHVLSRKGSTAMHSTIKSRYDVNLACSVFALLSQAMQ